jgi:hypothetical protein
MFDLVVSFRSALFLFIDSIDFVSLSSDVCIFCIFEKNFISPFVLKQRYLPFLYLKFFLCPLVCYSSVPWCGRVLFTPRFS